LGRIRAVLRRTSQAARAADATSVRAYRFAGWRLDTLTRSLTDVTGASVPLGGAEYRLLVTLLETAPKLLSRAELMELVRGRELDPFDRSIDVRVSRLRQILGDDARAPQIIKTVYGEGYVVGVTVVTD
jgi:two-component system OmpR family response regulator